jgi:hypothetical protein
MLQVLKFSDFPAAPSNGQNFRMLTVPSKTDNPNFGRGQSSGCSLMLSVSEDH